MTTLTLKVYKNQKEVYKTFETDAYDIMYGTIEDVLSIMDEVGTKPSNEEIFKAVSSNRQKLNDLLKDIFPEMTDEDIRMIKVKELVPFFFDLLKFVTASFGSKN